MMKWIIMVHTSSISLIIDNAIRYIKTLLLKVELYSDNHLTYIIKIFSIQYSSFLLLMMTTSRDEIQLKFSIKDM